jgi:hypothetical protein
MAYQITVAGHLDAKWADWFDGMAIEIGAQGADRPVTTLTGILADQSALHGILARIRDLNLTIVSVVWLDPAQSTIGS